MPANVQAVDLFRIEGFGQGEWSGGMECSVRAVVVVRGLSRDGFGAAS